MKKFIEVRCPFERPHGKYETCGHLLGGISDTPAIFYCPTCKRFLTASVENNNVVVCTPVSSNQRVNFQKLLKIVE